MLERSRYGGERGEETVVAERRRLVWRHFPPSYSSLFYLSEIPRLVFRFEPLAPAFTWKPIPKP
ncbi:hypothetical protein L484_006291 [Morus notabilis]|uniref:Uncharacterized protein n=1 Tax=Morus notabilis TaxID=981085 RepID=W9R3K8_9ROSA|nr:hypothetical protein L484_006291 [Morus notabilis]